VPQGSLTVVGTGIASVSHLTKEVAGAISQAEVVLYLVADPLTVQYIIRLNHRAASLYGCYRKGEDRGHAYERMVRRILTPVRRGKDVCAAFYGHPGVFAYPSHESVRRARAEGYPARMLPGISADACLYADLGVDPGAVGCQHFEATDFLVYRRKFDPTSALIIWQIGVAGIATYETRTPEGSPGLRVLTDVLLQSYPPSHEVVVYEAPSHVVCDPVIRRTPLMSLPDQMITMTSTLYVPPVSRARVDRDMLRRLGLSQRAPRARR